MLTAPPSPSSVVSVNGHESPAAADYAKALTLGRSILEDACSRAEEEGLLRELDEVYRLKRRETLLSDHACRLFDDEALRRGLDPAEAADDLEQAKLIEETPVVAKAFRLADRADTRARAVYLPRERLKKVLSELRPALDVVAPLRDDAPSYLVEGLDAAVTARLSEACRWLPRALFAADEEAAEAWRRHRLAASTGDLAQDYAWALALRSGTGSGVSSFIDQVYDTLAPLPPRRRPRACDFALLAAADEEASGFYRDWPYPTIAFRGVPSTGTAVHELAHWVEARLLPRLLSLQHTHLRRRQARPLETAVNSRWTAPMRIPAGMLNHYQECWYSRDDSPPQAFEVLTTTLQRLVEERAEVLEDPDTLALCLGGLALAAAGSSSLS